jgi:transposase
VLLVYHPIAYSSDTMPMRYITPGLKLAAVRMYEGGHMQLPQILRIVNFSRSTFFRTWEIWRTRRHVVLPPSPLVGRPRLMVKDDLDYILDLIRHNPSKFLDELGNMLENSRFIAMHWSTICRALIQAGVSHKKLRKIAQERNENVRSDFRLRMAAYTIDQVGWMDEVHKDEKTTRRTYGRSRRNTRAEELQPFERGSRLTGTGLLTKDGMVAVHTCYGSMTAEKLVEWLEDDVVSEVSCIY